ncbi:MAG: DNA mismatch repair protein MutS [Muribaculaceae bacterium]|nr:DNA mismatch repair protein MutS [Muribaculaceae bacterium]MDE7368467.1 DNA mismatch repair protein MutS [Muribaculaceae bacterium]
MAKKVVETPLMKQYFEMKQKHPDAVLLFRVGDFYETFSDDAITTSEILGITLTRRANGAASSVELAGFPHHALDTYLPKLVRAGKRVAICEQLEDPKLTKTLVKRGITELVTPGVTLNDNVLDHRTNNFLAAINFGRKEHGVSFLDLSTGEFLVAQGDLHYIDKLFSNFEPKEILVERGSRQKVAESFSGRYLINELDDWVFTSQSANERLLKQFGTRSLKGFGIVDMPEAVIAAGAVLQYLDITQHSDARHITRISRIEQDHYVRIDRFTARNLELIDSFNPDGKSLLGVLDHTVTPAGARLLHRWLMFPLKDQKAINRRLDIVEFFFRNPDVRESIREQLEQIGDLERLTSKLTFSRISPRELVTLRNALTALGPIKQLCLESGVEPLVEIGKNINPAEELRDRIARTIVDDAPIAVNRGSVIRQGFNAELDELRRIATGGKDFLIEIQRRESAETGIPSLKIGFNNVFGYYIEVTNTHRDKVPEQWIRKQTLVNAERYITPELKEYEEKILGAQDKIEQIETRLFAELLAVASNFSSTILTDARMTATLDVLLTFCIVAMANRYNRPVVDDSLKIELRNARHPVIERELPAGTPYIANDISLDNESTQIMMITGPNMSGKSALLRSTALNVLMAQIGSFIPCDSAHIGVVDKIFTRVGASDNIALGESTFMVEMNEAASILNNMSQRSLILFDELGRGTSTYDGISIAWAIVEHIHEYGNMHPKTLFATHYHELNEMEKSYDRIVNFNVSVKEINGKVVFLRKLVRGGSEHSFGIHVAKLAGMPQSIVSRSEKVLKHLETINRDNKDGNSTPVTSGIMPAGNESGVQLSFFQLDDPVLTNIRDSILGLDINNLTPVEALNKLNDIRRILTGKD